MHRKPWIGKGVNVRYSNVVGPGGAGCVALLNLKKLQIDYQRLGCIIRVIMYLVKRRVPTS
jgi:hypothetical protein